MSAAPNKTKQKKKRWKRSEVSWRKRQGNLNCIEQVCYRTKERLMQRQYF